MTFIWPTALLLLAVVAGLAVLYVLAQRRRNRYALRYANLSLVREAIGKGPGWRRHVPPALFILALAFMAIAVARPQAVVAVPSQEGTVILAIDVSGSMLAEDMKPNRMEAAKAAARAVVAKQSERQSDPRCARCDRGVEGQRGGPAELDPPTGSAWRIRGAAPQRDDPTVS